MQNGWIEGGVLSATIFCIYMDELISRLERSGIGCYIGNEYYGNISYADDLKLLVLIVYTGWVQICGDVNTRVDIHGYDTQSSENMDYTSHVSSNNCQKAVVMWLKRYGMSYPLMFTKWARDNMAAIFRTKCRNGFSWMKIYEFRFKFHWSVFLVVQLRIFQHWFRKWFGDDQATSHYLNQWWRLVYWHIYASHGLNELTNIQFLIHLN